MNQVIKGLITAIWTHGHGCGANNERTLAGKSMAERIQKCSDDLNEFLPDWEKQVTDILGVMMAQIPPYITEKAHSFDWFRYLHVHGGSGINPLRETHRSGGEYNIILFYASPGEMEGIGSHCARLWCIGKNIVFGEGDTIYHAYQDYLTKIKK